jgi:hypothetical protein
MYVRTSTLPKLATYIYRTPADGINVRVGKTPHAQTVHISRAALRTAPVLRRLFEGVRIINTDPIIFTVAMQYIEKSGFFARMQPFGSNPCDQLIDSEDMMLNLAKSWHLGYMLDLPKMQNKVIDTRIVCYRQSLKSGIRVLPCQESFNHLRLYVGYRTKCERILFDFYAGLAFHGEDFRPEELEQLPRDIAQELQQRRARMAVDKKLANCLARSNEEYKVSAADNTLPSTLHVLPPQSPLRRRTDTLPPISSGLQLPISSVANGPTETPHPTMPVNKHRSRLSLPVLLKNLEDLDQAIVRANGPI